MDRSRRRYFRLWILLGILVVASLLVYYQVLGQNWVITGKPLSIPMLLENFSATAGEKVFYINVQSGMTEFFEGRQTPTLGYNGSYLGPVMRIRRGDRVRVHVSNDLDEPTTLHWHGLIVAGEHDGGPHQGIAPQETWTPEFTIDQPAATLWFHPHYAHTASDQVYAGLSGLIIIDDEVSESLPLPQEYGIDDIPLIVQDRSFYPDGHFAYRLSMMGTVSGDTLLVNGTVRPYLSVSRDTIRLRILNGSNSQNFLFRMNDDSSFLMIASDGGLLEAPVTLHRLMLSPGERAEIVLDFGGTNKLTRALMSDRQTVLQFKLDSEQRSSTVIPAALGSLPDPFQVTPVGRRTFVLQSMGLQGSINGKFFNPDRIDEIVKLHDYEEWIVRNPGGMMHATGHPFHVHGVQFRILSRNGQPPSPLERGLKDTVFVDTGDEVRILVQFTRPGLFMYHCHILEHEDRGMMGQILVED